jgi:hypothetical protein
MMISTKSLRSGMLAVALWTFAGAGMVYGSDNALAAGPHACAADAMKRAPALLKYHLPDAGHPFGFSPKAEQVPPINNPVVPTQQFDVLQVWGFVYKAKYRLRFIYAQLPGSCVLMGQEVLEYARL